MFKIEIDRVPQHTTQHSIISTEVHYGTVFIAVPKVSIGIMFVQNSTNVSIYLFYDVLEIGSADLKLLKIGRFHFITKRSCISKARPQLYEFYSRQKNISFLKHWHEDIHVLHEIIHKRYKRYVYSPVKDDIPLVCKAPTTIASRRFN